MEPLLIASKTDVTTIEFYPLSLHPHALWYVQKLNGEAIREGALPRHVVDNQDPTTLVQFLTTHVSPFDNDTTSDAEKSLPLNATFWPVLRTDLFKAEAELWPEEGQMCLKNAEDPNYVLIHKSGYDHQLWGVDRKPLLAPLRLEIWGSKFHLRRLGEHLIKTFPQHFSDFEIVPNPVWQNHEITGRSYGCVTFDPTEFKFPKKSRRSIGWCEDHFFKLNGYGESGYDPFGVSPFRIEQ